MSDPKPGPSGTQKMSSDSESDDLLSPEKTKNNRNVAIVYSDSDSEYEGDMNMNIEPLDGDIFENSDWEDFNDDESESEIEELETEVSEDTERWDDDGDFKKIPFVGKPGLQKLPKGGDPYDFFELFFDDTFFSMTVKETNEYGKITLGEKWKELTISEFKIFLSLLLHTGTIKCPRIENYWNTSKQFGFKCFSRFMSRQRFQNILRCLHFSSDYESDNRLRKIIPVIDYFNAKMKDIYNPHRELSIDESIVPWRGRLTFKQYIANKKHKHGVKLYIICESSGTVLRIKVYTGSGDDISGKGHVDKVVFHLMKDFLHQGHSLFMDNFYTSFDLVKKLVDCKTYCTGTLRKGRKGNNCEVIKKKLLKNEVISRYKNNIIMGKFKDKRDVLFISSEYKATLFEYENKRKTKILKPSALHQYNEYMNGIDRKDQMLSYYSCTRRTFKWYIKLWINLVETLLVNSFNLYKMYSPSTAKFNFYQYRLEILGKLIENPRDHPLTTPEPEDHFPEILPRGENRKVQRKICRLCYKNGKYRRTNYSCRACVGNPGLCLGDCFKNYHSGQQK